MSDNIHAQWLSELTRDIQRVIVKMSRLGQTAAVYRLTLAFESFVKDNGNRALFDELQTELSACEYQIELSDNRVFYHSEHIRNLYHHQGLAAAVKYGMANGLSAEQVRLILLFEIFREGK